ncbi:MAG: hypothetical protein Q8P25_02560 [Candidatus Curtissbacteria bacterium]|nr:hypothetical protein [Candidatus Curtissbacteria bacterium]
MSKKLAKFWPIIFLCLLTFFLRVVNIEQLFYFTYDEAIPAFVGRRLILWHHIPLIGGVTPFGFHLAPYFYWFYAFLLYIGKFNPIVWGYAGAAIAVITTLAIYKVGSLYSPTLRPSQSSGLKVGSLYSPTLRPSQSSGLKVGTLTGSKKIGFTAATFWTFSTLANLLDRHLWALYWGPLFSLVAIFLLYKIITLSSVIPAKAGIKTVRLYTYLLGATIALAIHADPSNLIFLLLAAVVWILYKIPFAKSTFIGVLLIILSFLPLAIFDLRHNFANTRPVLEYVRLVSGTNQSFETHKVVENALLFPRTFTRLVYIFGDNQIAKQYSYCRNYISEKFDAIPNYFMLFSLAILLLFIRSSLKSKDKNQMSFLVALLVGIYFISIQIYGTFFKGDIFEHYITGLLPAFLLILAQITSKLPKKMWIGVLAVFVALNLYKLSQARNDLGLTAKRQAIEYTMQQVGDRSFSLDSLSTCWKLSGYRYLFTVFGREPVKSYVDPNLSYLYGTTPVAEKHPQTVVSFVAHDFVPETDEFYSRYARLKSHEVNSALFGKIEVIILNNSTGWFDQPQERVRPNIPNGVD